MKRLLEDIYLVALKISLNKFFDFEFLFFVQDFMKELVEHIF